VLNVLKKQDISSDNSVNLHKRKCLTDCLRKHLIHAEKFDKRAMKGVSSAASMVSA